MQTSRGIDADRIDLVINLDLPFDHETYLHRVGRAGRFGANGAAITLHTQTESEKLDKIARQIDTSIHVLPGNVVIHSKVYIYLCLLRKKNLN